MSDAHNFSFCPVLDDLVRTQRVTGQTGKVFEGLGALSTPNNLSVLRALMLERKPSRTLEVGVSFGGSALTIAASHRDLGQVASHQHTAIDPFQHSVWDNCGIAALERAGLSSFVAFRPQYSSVALADLLDHGKTFDLIYIDGSHRFDDVFVDAYFAFRLLARDGVVLFDDSSTDDVATVLSFVTTNWNEWAKEIDLSSYHPDGGALKYRAARAMGKLQLRAFQRAGNEPAWDAPLRRF